MSQEVILSLGVLLYESKRYLKDFFKSVNEQDLKGIEVLVGDNNVKKKEGDLVNGLCLRAKVHEFGNVGFAKGHNRLFQKSLGKYYACLNPDMVFEKDYLRRLVEVLEGDDTLGSVQGKILRFDRETVDSLGLEMKAWGVAKNKDEGGRLRIKDSKDIGDEFVFGVTGAAAVYRREAFDVVGRFDEEMFMYKEDVDLAYRLQKHGWRAKCVMDAVAYHDRTAALGGRRHRSLRERKWSYSNHLRFLSKIWKDQPMWKKGLIVGYEGLKLVYGSVFERSLVGGFREFWGSSK